MGQKFKILGSLVAFLILAGISCWATEKSLHLLLPAGWYGALLLLSLLWPRMVAN